jgi:hypothetical protein
MCGGGYILPSREHTGVLQRTGARDLLEPTRIKRQEVEARTLRAMRELFFDRGALQDEREARAAARGLLTES